MDTPFDPIARLREVIERYRFSVQLVGYGECSVPGCDCEPERFPWAYTVGLVEAGLPELVLLGFDLQHAHLMVNHVGYSLLAGTAPATAGTEFEWQGHPLRLSPVPAEWLVADPARLGAWFEYYGRQGGSVRFPEVLQVLWADEQGRFPDAPECAGFVNMGQVVLAANPRSFPTRPSRPSRRAGTVHRRGRAS